MQISDRPMLLRVVFMFIASFHGLRECECILHGMRFSVFTSSGLIKFYLSRWFLLSHVFRFNLPVEVIWESST